MENFEQDQNSDSRSSRATLVAVAKTAWQDKNLWRLSDIEPSPASASGKFRRILKGAVGRKADKRVSEQPRPQRITLNLHQFYLENGDSLGEDPERWAKLTF